MSKSWGFNRLSHRLPNDRLPLGGVSLANVAEINFVVFAAQLRPTSLNKLVHLLDGWAFG